MRFLLALVVFLAEIAQRLPDDDGPLLDPGDGALNGARQGRPT